MKLIRCESYLSVMDTHLEHSSNNCNKNVNSNSVRTFFAILADWRDCWIFVDFWASGSTAGSQWSGINNILSPRTSELSKRIQNDISNNFREENWIAEETEIFSKYSYMDLHWWARSWLLYLKLFYSPTNSVPYYNTDYKKRVFACKI